MGKNHRHKKDLKAEKAKVKLKQTKTKFLPKGLNVTNTSFKIKPIVINEQLKQKSFDEILSKRKLNIKDLLSRIKHHNENVRHAACEELTDILKTFTDEMFRIHLSDLCRAVSSLMQDREHKVRKAAIKSIATIVEKAPNGTLVPLFDFFSINVRCAMTNIDKNIQEDSLLFLDCFIKNDIGLIRKCSDKLFPDFLSLISKLQSDSELGRTLTMNLGSKLTSVAWRIKVLSRLHAILSIIVGKSRNDSNVSTLTEEHVFDASSRYYFPIYKTKFATALYNPSLEMFSRNYTTSTDSTSVLNRHIPLLLPLLHQTWLEVMPEHKSNCENSVLNDEAAALLTCITNTLYLLRQYVQTVESDSLNLKTVFLCAEGQKFLDHLLANFPYCQSEKQQKKTKNGNLLLLGRNTDPKCSQENLQICFLYLNLFVNCTQRNLKKEMAVLGPYLTETLNRKSLREESMECLLELLAECLGGNYKKWLGRGIDLNLVLENAVRFYRQAKFGSHLHQAKLFEIFENVAVTNPQLNRNPTFQNWISTLPNLLCESTINCHTITRLLQLSKKNCSGFHMALLDKLPEIIAAFDNLEIIGTTDSLLNTRARAEIKLSAIFYFVPKYTRTNWEMFRHFIKTGESTSFKGKLKGVLESRKDFKIEYLE